MSSIGEDIKILLPYDGGDASKKALDEAIALAHRLGASITLIHVLQPIESGYSVFHWHQPRIEERYAEVEGTEIRDTASIKFLEETESKLRASGINYNFISETSYDVSDRVSSIVEEDAIDLVVMGSRDPVNHEVPREILSELKVPILVVK